MFLFKLFQTLKSSAHPILINFEITEVSTSFNIPPLSLQKKLLPHFYASFHMLES